MVRQFVLFPGDSRPLAYVIIYSDGEEQRVNATWRALMRLARHEAARTNSRIRIELVRRH